MDKTTTSSSYSLWRDLKDASKEAWSFYVTRFFKAVFVAILIGILYLSARELLFPFLDKLHGFLLEHHLMLYFRVLIGLGVVYLWCWMVKYWKADWSIEFFVGICLVIILYGYELLLCPACYFWPIIDDESGLTFGDFLLLSCAVIFALQRGAYLLFFKRKVWQFPPSIIKRILEKRKVENDKPITAEEEDWLGFTDQVDAVFEDLQVLKFLEDRSSLTLGIIAQWGKGKSSFTNLLMAKAKKQGDIVVCFNPRSSKNASQIQEDFFDAFAKELSKYYIGFGFLLGRYTKHLGLLGQYEWTRPLESLLTLLLPEMDEQAINGALRMIDRRVYVAIDDLDRLTGEEIIEVLKLVDRNASFNNVVFVMAYDKEYVNNVLRKHLDHGLDHSFIDKYVTWEVTLPEIDGEVLRKKMTSYLTSHLSGLPDEEKKRVLEGWGYVGSIIVEDLASVRHLKRYVNLTLYRYRGVYSKVDPADFFLLSLLQYRYLGIYNNLARGIYVELSEEDSQDPYLSLSVDNHRASSGVLPADASVLLEKMFYNLPVGREDKYKGGLPYNKKELKLIRSKDVFPYYFRYMKDKAEEK